MSAFTNSFSEETWFQKYKFKDDASVEDTWKRVAGNLASVEDDPEKWKKKFYKALEGFKFVPGGRITSNAGTGIKGTTYINCFHGDTEIITREGIVKINDVVDQDVMLLGRAGKWSSGHIKCFGRQRIWRLVVRKNRQTKSILTTANHKWFAYTKAKPTPIEITTDQLQSYHMLEQATSKSHSSTSPSPIGIAQGFTYGDGSTTKDSVATHWKVLSVEDTGIDDFVYCAVVPVTHKFTLEGNILTSNCFVDGFEGQDQDSIEGIYGTLTKQAQILKSEGGYGFCADIMRPNGSHIHGIANQSPGSVKFLELWDKSSEIITAGSNKKAKKDQKNFIRKGAQMVTMSCWHPDIMEFIEAKKTPGRLTKFNMSVLCTDEFMNAVREDSPWYLAFPRYDLYPTDYKEFWNGDIEAWKHHIQQKYQPNGDHWDASAIEVYHKFNSARELWNLIMDNTYNRNEPGVLFVDTMNRMNNLHWLEWINATNPCVVEGTLVNTPNGYRKVEDIVEKDEISTVLGVESVASIEKHDSVPVFEVEFSDGVCQTVTAAHRYHVSRKGTKSKQVEKLRLDEIKIEDKVRVYSSEFDDKTMYPTYKYGLRAGILLGDRCYTDNQLSKSVVSISTSQDDVEYNDLVKSYAFEYYPFNKDDINPNSKSMKLMLKISKKDILSLGLTPQYSHEKDIDFQKINNLGFAVGMLDGLLATDGNVNLTSNHPQLRWDTTSYSLAKTIRRTLLYFGCHGFISSSESEGGTINGRKIERNYTKYTVTISGESIRNYAKYSRLDKIHPEKAQKLLKSQTDFRLSGNRWCAEVKSIKPCGNAKVYDLYCEKSDTWITEGYVQQGCGEQVLPIGAVCLLGSINLVHFIDPITKEWKWKELKEAIHAAIRFMDNVNDITHVPLESQKKNLKQKRRIGLGVLGYGSAMLMARVKYGSPKALKMTEELMSFFTNEAYKASALLAKEKGSFELYDEEEYLKGEFIQQLDPETIALIKKHGMRNSHVTSIQPTGNSSCFANLVSGGLEPLFMHGYIRTSIQPNYPDGLPAPLNVDWKKKTFEIDLEAEGDMPAWKWVKEGDENLLATTFDGKTWKLDSHRGLTKEEWIEDYGVSVLKELGKWNPEAQWSACTMDLDVDAHVNTMSIFAKWVDSAISKTINLPNEYPYDDFKMVYIKAWENGIKGFTTYRAGTMTSVLAAESSLDEDEDKIRPTISPDRPRELPCEVYHIKVRGESYFVLVGLYNGDPYEVFAGKNGFIDKKVSTGTIIKLGRPKGVYKAILENGLELSPINQTCSAEEDALTRMTSLGLRHGADMHLIVQQLEKVKGDMTCFAKSMARAIKKYIPDGAKEKGACPECESVDSLIRQEGCVTCTQCGFSKCA